MSAGEFLEEEFCTLRSHLIDLRGHGQGGKRRRGGSSFVAAALFKIDAGLLYGMLA